MTNFSVNEKTKRVYKVYSRFYPLLSLLAYWIVWRGSIFRHISFFREIKNHSHEILDIATGDGSLTKLALFNRSSDTLKVTCLDISPDMLSKAKKKLPHDKTRFLIADVMNLPFSDNSQKCITCFGGLNSFPSGQRALSEIARVLSPGGVLRGSVLLLPQAQWRQNLIHKWIQDGYQTEVVTFEIFKSWIDKSRLKLNDYKIYGDVLLFQITH